MLKAKPFLAIDFGAGTLKVAEFEINDAGVLVLRQFGAKSLGLEGSQESARERVVTKALQEFIARDADEFVRLAATLAADRARLASLRSELRPRLLASPLCDAKAYAARFAEAIEHAWAEHR